jgi:hypothetical protein
LAHKNKNLNLVDIFKNFIPSKNIIDYIIYTNIEIANNQFKELNDIVEYINSLNYYGDTYQMKRDLQIYANKYWIDRFYPTVTDFNKKYTIVRNNTLELIQQNDILIRNEIQKYN